jgi:hypothetical protein
MKFYQIPIYVKTERGEGPDDVLFSSKFQSTGESPEQLQVAMFEENVEGVLASPEEFFGVP